VLLTFADGSIATIHYFANGHRAFPKERVEIFCQGRVLELDNFRVLRGYGWKNFRKMRLFRQDKGHAAEIAQFIDRVAKGGAPLIDPTELWNVTAATLAAQQATMTPVAVAEGPPC
jgi:predicted dehydrogenase